MRQLLSRKIPYEYHETARGRSWEYRDTAVRPMLRVIEDNLCLNGARCIDCSVASEPLMSIEGLSSDARDEQALASPRGSLD